MLRRLPRDKGIIFVWKHKPIFLIKAQQLKQETIDKQKKIRFSLLATNQLSHKCSINKIKILSHTN